MQKLYNIGMYGGKFLPFHKGHRYCAEVAAHECETVYVILFHGGPEEEEISIKTPQIWLSVEERKKQLEKICSELDNVAHMIPALIDISRLRLPDGSEDWEAETPLVRALLGDKLDSVYSSEEHYDEYFAKAYPEAVHRLVDVPREHYPISGTKVRAMADEADRRNWMV